MDNQDKKILIESTLTESINIRKITNDVKKIEKTLPKEILAKNPNKVVSMIKPLSSQYSLYELNKEFGALDDFDSMKLTVEKLLNQKYDKKYVKSVAGVITAMVLTSKDPDKTLNLIKHKIASSPKLSGLILYLLLAILYYNLVFITTSYYYPLIIVGLITGFIKVVSTVKNENSNSI